MRHKGVGVPEIERRGRDEFSISNYSYVLPVGVYVLRPVISRPVDC